MTLKDIREKFERSIVNQDDYFSEFKSLLNKLIEKLEGNKGESAKRLNNFLEGHKSGLNDGLDTAISEIKKLID